ncbi:MAG: nucleoside-triphosphatase, partial [Planctomycetota bacterium]
MNRKPAPGPTHILLLTGLPGIGKTTVAEKVAEALQPLPLGGFVTGEIRQGGKRVGFRLRAFGRAPEILAHVDRKSPRRVGRYGVDLEVLERCAEGTLQPDPPRAAYIVDEIGKMECLS